MGKVFKQIGKGGGFGGEMVAQPQPPLNLPP